MDPRHPSMDPDARLASITARIDSMLVRLTKLTSENAALLDAGTISSKALARAIEGATSEPYASDHVPQGIKGAKPTLRKCAM